MNIKALIEKRNSLLIAMDAILNKAGAETRAMTADETTDYDAKKAEVEGLTATIAAMQDAEKRAQKPELSGGKAEATIEAKEYRAFESFVRKGIITEELRTGDPSDNDLDKADGTVTIPTTIANKIIETVKQLSPIYDRVTKINAKGTLSFPIWGKDGTDDITCAYATEGTEPLTNSGKFTEISLTGFLFSAQAKISKTLINNSQFDIVAFIIRKIGEAVAEFYEKELIVGTANKMAGALSATNGVTAAAEAAITADELIGLQAAIPAQLQGKCEWLMNPKTLTALRKLKYTDGTYIVNRDFTKGFGWEILGKSVMISENMPEVAASAKAIVYGDFSAIWLKTAEAPTMQVLNELYAKQHKVGISLFGESDSKIIEPQKLRLLTMKAAAAGGT